MNTLNTTSKVLYIQSQEKQRPKTNTQSPHKIPSLAARFAQVWQTQHNKLIHPL